MAETAEWVFEVEKTRLIGEARLNKLLNQLNPSEFPLHETVSQIDSYSYFKNPDSAASEFVLISVAFKKIPDLNHPELQVLKDFLNRNILARVQVIVPGASRSELRDLERKITIQVLAHRARAGRVSGGVNITFTSDALAVSRFVSGSGKALIYSEIESILTSASRRPATSRVRNNTRTGEEASKALIASIKDILEKKEGSIPQGIRNALEVLAEHLEILQAAAEATLKAA